MKSTLREKHRYVGIRIITESEVNKLQLQSAINHMLIKTMGEIGFARADPKLVYVGRECKTAVIRCAHIQADAVRAGLALITDIAEKRSHLMPVFTSGTILKCKAALAKTEL